MQPYLTIEETISIPRLSRLAVSEDGARLAWVETVANWDKNEYRKHVQIYDVRTASRLPVTGGDNQSHSPAWSVANQLAWLSPVGEGDDKA